MAGYLNPMGTRHFLFVIAAKPCVIISTCWLFNSGFGLAHWLRDEGWEGGLCGCVLARGLWYLERICLLTVRQFKDVLGFLFRSVWIHCVLLQQLLEIPLHEMRTITDSSARCRRHLVRKPMVAEIWFFKFLFGLGLLHRITWWRLALIDLTCTQFFDEAVFFEVIQLLGLIIIILHAILLTLGHLKSTLSNGKRLCFLIAYASHGSIYALFLSKGPYLRR